MANKTFQLWFASWHHPRFPSALLPFLVKLSLRWKRVESFTEFLGRQQAAVTTTTTSARVTTKNGSKAETRTHTPTHAHARGLIKKSCGNIPCQNADTNKHSSWPNPCLSQLMAPLYDQLTIWPSSLAVHLSLFIAGLPRRLHCFCSHCDGPRNGQFQLQQLHKKGNAVPWNLCHQQGRRCRRRGADANTLAGGAGHKLHVVGADLP